MSQRGLATLLIALVFSSQAYASPPRSLRMGEQLTLIRGQILQLEQELIETARAQKEATAALSRAKKLYKLQQKERDLGLARIKELEQTLSDLEVRRGSLREKVNLGKKQVRHTLESLWVSAVGKPVRIDAGKKSAWEVESVEAPRREVLARYARRGVRELELLKADLIDADELEKKVQEEKSQLAYIFESLGEQAAILELNQQMQVDLISKRHNDRINQLENFKKLKEAEQQVQDMIAGLNARKELEKALETERSVQRDQMQRGLKLGGDFASLKGFLSLPGKQARVLSRYGKSYDPKSNLYVFKKGIELDIGKSADVLSVAAGKVAFAGELQGYGTVTIIDHGGHYYSLLAHLGSLDKKQGDAVRAGERVGQSDVDGNAIYFEIRAKSLPVDPLEWIVQKEKSCDRLGSC